MADDRALFAFAALALVLTATATSAALRLRSPVSFALAVYVLTSAEIVGLTEVLSLLDGVGSRGYAIGEAVLGGAALAAWLARGRPLPPLPSLDRGAFRRHRLLAALAALVAAAFIFQGVLAVMTPPNNADSMTYHLTRVAEWHQRGAVERYPTSYEAQNAYPPNGEMEILYTVSFVGRDALAALPQFFARLALLAAVFGLARLAGFSRPAAAFAALVFACLTLVVVQGVTTQNHLVVAALIAATAFFVLEAARDGNAAASLAGAAFGLAAGTKWTTLAAVPLLAVLVVAATRTPRTLSRLAAWAVLGVGAFGLYGYLVNLVETGNPLGDVSTLSAVATHPAPKEAVATVYRLLTDFGDFSAYFENANEDTSRFGTLGWALILPVAAGFVLAWFLGRTRPVRGALAAAMPLFLVVLALTHPYERFDGRLLILPVAISVPLVAWTYRYRWIAGAAGLLAAVSLVLAIVFNPAKPVGVLSTPVWELSRVSAQTLMRPEMDDIFSAVDSSVPKDARVGAVLAQAEWSYFLYGRTLERRVTYLAGPDAPAEADRLGLHWLVFSSGELTKPVLPGWRVTTFDLSGWSLAERS